MWIHTFSPLIMHAYLPKKLEKGNQWFPDSTVPYCFCSFMHNITYVLNIITISDHRTFTQSSPEKDPVLVKPPNFSFIGVPLPFISHPIAIKLLCHNCLSLCQILKVQILVF